ncbi:MAG: hypothetical protein A2Z42_03580 [Candidatus Woykebacteria bacterium RBG_19FT_COMBO_43_10]|uniref:Uncharacterized protein n=1 Tax=Candidatus Woykebacteria bacterium RBG_19FT_COMBO_43_10 TaxID=1802598 RepID=A0A1G1WI19_9BACT|nr:MAG: hypothetical protein A2Z42_03580 [Candidatus Woykebacteria bacterium RBG_19FT_COMBO_43_10]
MIKQVLRVTELFDVSGHLTERGIEVVVGYCFDQEELPEPIITGIQRHIGLFARSRDFRECEADCQERVLDSLGEGGIQRAREKALFTWISAS